MNCIERGHMAVFIHQVFGYSLESLTKKTDTEIEVLYQRAIVKDEAPETLLGRFYRGRHD